MLKKFPLEVLQKMPAFSLSRAPTHHSFTFNLQFLRKLKHMVHLFENVWWIFQFRSRLAFIKTLYFHKKKKHGLFDFKTS